MILPDYPFIRRTVLLGCALLALVVLTRMLYDDFARARELQVWVSHTYQVLDAIQAVNSTREDADKARRLYLVTGEDTYRLGFEAAVENERAGLHALRTLTVDNAEQQALLATYNRLAEEQFSELRKFIALRQKASLDTFVSSVRAYQAREAGDRCAVVMTAVEKRERGLLIKRTQDAEVQSMRMRWGLGLGSGSLLILLLLASAVIERDSRNRERAEEALRESEAQFRTLANAIPQLCWIANGDGWIFWYNERWYEYSGTTPKDMEGWGWESLHDPAELPKVRERWQASIASGDPFDMIFPMRGADGEFHPFLTRIMPLRGRDGKVARWFGTNTDITDQRKIEEDLRRASEQRRLALEAAEQGAWELRVDTGEVFWDDACCRMFGIPATQQVSVEDARRVIHGEDLLGNLEAWKQALGGGTGGIYHREFRVVWPDGSVHWLASYGRVNFGEEGVRPRPVHFAGVLMDITERKKAELEILQLNSHLEQRVRQRTAELETANRELEAFAYSVSHDLRAPLRGIDGWSLALAEDYAAQLDGRAHKYLDRVRSEAQRMGHLIDDMLQLSRVARADMQVVPVNLTDIARGIAAELAEANSGRRIDFVIEPGLTAQGDPRLLEIALTNLLSNAVKFTGPREQAHIEFARSRHNGSEAFYVQDNGVGFEMAYSDKLFRAFQRLHKSSEFPGTGIGLATVQRVITRHGGKVWADAQTNHRATFYFTIGEIG